MGKKVQEENPTGIERRRARRRPILDTFAVHLVIPKKGLFRLTVHDLSEIGIGFDLDIEGENSQSFPVKSGDNIDVRLYLNQSLFIPLEVRVARVEEQYRVRRVGAEFSSQKNQYFEAFIGLMQFLDRMSDALKVE